MTDRNGPGDLYDPRNGDEPIRLGRWEIDGEPSEPARTNEFAIYLVESGSGIFWADASTFPFGPGSLLCFVPYQHLRFVPEGRVRGQVVRFHANFLCVETFHAEVGCSGALFNDPYGPPSVELDDATKAEVAGLLDRLRREDARRDLAYGEAMLALLKVVLILATRIKASRAGACGPDAATAARHPILAELRALIEEHYRTIHSPAEYAKRLHVTPKTLGRLVREHFGTTPTDLIRSRILIHAKWQLLHTLKPVKEVAREVGFGDELYFSRLFKKATGYSPTFFRAFETEIRGGSNLSMSSAEAPILPPAESPDT
ncbi:AraC family transcriptional regulator [Tautonia sp. JC769]|uniref:helix-turn-helix domain-containing protein n=1 Tax=Tautonia sp. JC769 TaxID=3232135 RepID=UPI003458458A